MKWSRRIKRVTATKPHFSVRVYPFFERVHSVGTGVTGYRQAVFSSIQMDEVRQQLRLEAINTSTSLCVCNSPELRSGIQLCASVTIRNNKEDIDESATSTRIAALAFKCRQCKKMIPQCQQPIRVDWTKRSIRPSTSRISTCLECRYDGRKRRDDPKFSTFTPSAVVDESNAVVLDSNLKEIKEFSNEDEFEDDKDKDLLKGHRMRQVNKWRTTDGRQIIKYNCFSSNPRPLSTDF
eukprot:g83093.t1